MKKRTRKNYSEEFKRLVVEDYLSGYLTQTEIRTKYQISGSSSILYWLRQFDLADKEPALVTSEDFHQMKKKPIEIDKSSNKTTSVSKSLAEENADLKILLEYYRGLIESAKKDLNIDIEKKLNTK